MHTHSIFTTCPIFGTLINPFVSSTYENNMLVVARFECSWLNKQLLRWCNENNVRRFGDSRLDSIDNWLCFHHKTRSSSIRIVIDLLMVISTKSARIDTFNIDMSRIDRFWNKWLSYKTIKNSGKNTNTANTHTYLLVFNKQWETCFRICSCTSSIVHVASISYQYSLK